MGNFNDIFAFEYHEGLFIDIHNFFGHIYYSFVPAYEHLVNLKVRKSKFSDLVDIAIYLDYEKFYTLKEVLLDCEYGLLDLGSNIHLFYKMMHLDLQKSLWETILLFAILYILTNFAFLLKISENQTYSQNLASASNFINTNNGVECTFITNAV